MFHRGNRNKNSGWGRRGQNSDGYCVCTKCGYAIPHIHGQPCRNEVCPVCKTSLMNKDHIKAGETADNDSDNTSDIYTNSTKIKTINLPKVNPGICTGCGICIQNCPMQAIELVNGKAFIKETECTNCRLCESSCPFEAIS